MDNRMELFQIGKGTSVSCTVYALKTLKCAYLVVHLTPVSNINVNHLSLLPRICIKLMYLHK